MIQNAFALWKEITMEHLENKIIIHFQNFINFQKEIGPGVPGPVFNKHKICKIHTRRAESTHHQLHVVCAFGILAALMFVQRWTGALQV